MSENEQDGRPAVTREVPVDWEALEDAFENNAPEVHSYLHLTTGEVLRVVDGVASIADALIPACDRGAGWASAGDGANADLRAIADGARARGVSLSRVLDDLSPPAVDGGVR